MLPQSYQYPNLSEGADRVGGQLRGDKECPFSSVTKCGRIWRKVPESDARGVHEWSPLPCGYVAGAGCKHGEGGAGDRRGGEVVHCWTVASVAGMSTNDGES